MGKASLVFPIWEDYGVAVNVIARHTLAAFWARHPETEASLREWLSRMKPATFRAMNEVQAAFPKAKVLNAERVRFEIAGGNYRLIVAFKFSARIAFVKFIGTHADYDRVDALTVSHH